MYASVYFYFTAHSSYILCFSQDLLNTQEQIKTSVDIMMTNCLEILSKRVKYASVVEQSRDFTPISFTYISQ